MEEPIVMTPESTIKELEFALKHNISFDKHHVSELLNIGEVQDICNKLGLRAKLEAVYSAPDGHSCERAYYVLSFMNNPYTGFATYFGIDLVSSGNDYELYPENNSDEEEEDDE